MLSVFETIYIYECTFSNIKHIRSKKRICLKDETLSRHLLCVSTSEIKVDFAAL